MKKQFLVWLLIFATLLSFASCSGKISGDGYTAYDYIEGGKTLYKYQMNSSVLEENRSILPNINADDVEYLKREDTALKENDFIPVSEEAVSTFSADVDTASYTYMRKMIENGYNLQELKSLLASSLRTEELINYFSYDYTLPEENELFGVSSKIIPCPWNEGTKLLVLGLATEKSTVRLDNNLVFLIDVSGSMYSQDKLPLLKKAFRFLTDALTENDTVSIVTYSGTEAVVLEGCAGNKKEIILNKIDYLEASGSTNGQAGLEMAYTLAERYFKPEGNNRIIMASDGDLNVGISSAEELKKFVEGKRDQGVYLSVMGFGTGNYQDSKMEALADNGNGVYYYIDGEREAEKVFGNDIFSTLYTVAQDVKLQITFDSSAVAEYRLIGYENRLLNKEDFTDDTKDAGELGAGHTLTVCYELKMAGEVLENAPYMTLSVRYKNPGETQSVQKDYVIGKESEAKPDKDTAFICSVIESAMLLRGSKYLPKTVTLETVVGGLAEQDFGGDEYKAEFFTLLKKVLTAK